MSRPIICATAFALTVAGATVAQAVDYKAVTLTQGNNTYYAPNVPVRVHALGGNDTLVAGSAPVIFHGDAGNDELWLQGFGEAIGGSGDDEFYVRRANQSVINNATGDAGADYFSLTSIDDYRGAPRTQLWINDFSPAQGDRVRLLSYYTATNTTLTSYQIFDALDLNNDNILNVHDAQSGNGFYNLSVHHASLSLSWGYRSVTLNFAAVTRLAKSSVAP